MARRALTWASLVASLWIAFATGLPGRALAGGFEFQAPGTRALGRGGAFMARADDPMALGYNPAALAFLPGYQLQLGSHLVLYDGCVQRSGGYDDPENPGALGGFDSQFGAVDRSDPTNWVNQSFPQVCNSGPPGPSPQLVFSGHPLPGFGFAIGLLAPAGIGATRWGNEDGTVDANGTALPSPTRYALLEQNLILFHPSIGVGYSPWEWISFGVTLQWGIAIVDNVNHTSAGNGPEDPAQDVRTHLNVTDLFVPAIIASVHVVPIDQLDIVAMARISDSIDADGSLTLTTGTFGTGMRDSFTPFTTTLPGARLHAGQPWQFGLSVRYADRTSRRYRDPEQAGRVTGRVEDRMQNETWDIEVDVVYQLNSQVTDFLVTPPTDAEVGVCEGPSTCDGGTPTFSARLPGALPIPKGWGDQLAIRLGGDWNAIPGVFALRAGTHFETSGINPVYQTQDVLPGMRLGLHLGATIRIDRFDLSLAYAHIFQFTETVAMGNNRLVGATGMEGACADSVYDPNQPVVSRGCYPQGFGSVVNTGTYTAEMNVFSASMRYHFQ